MVIKKTLPISRSTWAEIGLLALASLFGMQALRALPRVIFFTFRSMPGVSHLDMVLLAFGVFLISLLSAPLRRLLKAPAALTLTAGGVVVAHVVQLLSLSPSVELVSVTVGVGLYLLFLPIYLGHLRGRGVDGMAKYGIGLLLGLTLDSGLHGIWEFWLLSEQFTGLLLLSLLMALLLLSCLASVVARSSRQSHSDGDFLPTRVGAGTILADTSPALSKCGLLDSSFTVAPSCRARMGCADECLGNGGFRLCDRAYTAFILDGGGIRDSHNTHATTGATGRRRDDGCHHRRICDPGGYVGANHGDTCRPRDSFWPLAHSHCQRDRYVPLYFSDLHPLSCPPPNAL